MLYQHNIYRAAASLSRELDSFKSHSGSRIFSGEENWCLLRIRSRCGLRFTKTEHSCLVHLSITPCISCLPYAREPEARPLGWLALKICASPKPAANKYQALAWSPKQTQEFELYPQASPLAEWLCVPSGKRNHRRVTCKLGRIYPSCVLCT